MGENSHLVTLPVTACGNFLVCEATWPWQTSQEDGQGTSRPFILQVLTSHEENPEEGKPEKRRDEHPYFNCHLLGLR